MILPRQCKIAPKMDEPYYEVNTAIPYGKFIDAVYWCLDNVEYNDWCMLQEDKQYYANNNVKCGHSFLIDEPCIEKFYFKDNNVAIQFKLMWG